MKFVLKYFFFIPVIGYGQLSLENIINMDSVGTITLTKVIHPTISFNEQNWTIRVNKNVLLKRIDIALNQSKGDNKNLFSRLFEYINDNESLCYYNFWKLIEEPVSIYDINNDKELGRRLLPELMGQVINDGLIELKINGQMIKEVTRFKGYYTSSASDVTLYVSIFTYTDGTPIWICLDDAIQ